MKIERIESDRKHPALCKDIITDGVYVERIKSDRKHPALCKDIIIDGIYVGYLQQMVDWTIMEAKQIFTPAWLPNTGLKYVNQSESEVNEQIKELVSYRLKHGLNITEKEKKQCQDD